MDTIKDHVKIIERLARQIAAAEKGSRLRYNLTQKHYYHSRRIDQITALHNWLNKIGRGPADRRYGPQPFRPRKRVLTPRVNDVETTPEKPLCAPHDFS